MTAHPHPPAPGLPPPNADGKLTEIAWLQPVRLEAEAFSQFSRRLSKSLAELERRHGVQAGDGGEPDDSQPLR